MPQMWTQLDRVYGTQSKVTDLQKDEYWKTFKGKRARFTGEVHSVSQPLWSLILGLKMKPSTLSITASVYEPLLYRLSYVSGKRAKHCIPWRFTQARWSRFAVRSDRERGA
jgi:hypothetical protein